MSDKIIMEAFSDELDKLAFLGQLGAFVAKKLIPLGTKIAPELTEAAKFAPGGAASKVLEGAQGMLRKPGEGGVSKVKDFLGNVASSFGQRVHLWTAPGGASNALRSEVIGLGHRVTDSGEVVKRTFNPIQSGWSLPKHMGWFGNAKVEQAGLQGALDYGHVAMKPLGGGLMGGAGMYTLNRLSGEDQKSSLGDAALWTVSPAAGMAKEIGSMGLQMSKAKRQQKALAEGQQVPGVPQSF